MGGTPDSTASMLYQEPRITTPIQDQPQLLATDLLDTTIVSQGNNGAPRGVAITNAPKKTA